MTFSLSDLADIPMDSASSLDSLLDADAKGVLSPEQKKKLSYKAMMAGAYALSYSTLGTLHSCPRKFELDKLTAKEEAEGHEDNLDFLFGHCVAMGIQCILAGEELELAKFHAMLAWNGDILQEATQAKKKNKTFPFAMYAIDQFWLLKDAFFDGWEVAMFNGKQAIELSFSITHINGYTYYGHVDVVLFNRELNMYRVLELKTTSFTNVHESIYKNSNQALGYSVVLDKIAEAAGTGAANSFDVFYLVYKAGAREFEPMPFPKSRSQRAIWLQDLVLDTEVIELYKKVGTFPMRGESCFNFFRPCEYFELCGLGNEAFHHPHLDSIKIEGELIPQEFQFSLPELIENQMAALGLGDSGNT